MAVPGGDTIKKNMVQMVEGLKPATVGFLLNDELGHHDTFRLCKTNT